MVNDFNGHIIEKRQVKVSIIKKFRRCNYLGFKKGLGISFFLLVLMNCESTKSENAIVEISNSGDFDRYQETISLPVDELLFLENVQEIEDVLVKDLESGEYQIIQWVDLDRVRDQLLFQIDIEAKQKKQFEILWLENGRHLQPKAETTTYSRFVPERTDDYTWENDLVAFRTFGPKAQQLVEDEEEGGTLSSGIDLWLKKVEYSIIDSWYAKNSEEPGYYHIEHGEGHDPYHVGKSRGAGGSGIWTGDSLLISENFIRYRTVATGPIRTIFELDYASWGPADLSETKCISLDLGSNFSKFEVSLKSVSDLPNYTLGITRHDKAGEVSFDVEGGLMQQWEPMPNGFLGVAVLADPDVVNNIIDFDSETPDQSQLLMITKPDKKITYYAGFAWTESGRISDKNEWDEMVVSFANRLKTPLVVSIE